MSGNSLVHCRFPFLLLAFCLWAGLARAGTPGGGPIAILLSDNDETYRYQARAFSEEVGMPTQDFSLQGDIQRDPGLKERLLATRPALVYALGAKAAFAAKLWTQDHQEIPVVFAMVLNWRRYSLLDGQANMAGIAAEVAPGTQFANLTLVSPNAKRIGLLYSPISTIIIEQARRDAAMLGLELVTEPIEDATDFQRGLKKIAGKIDAIWILNDPVLYTLENVAWLEKRCLREKLLCVGQSANLAKTGITLAVNPDTDLLSAQAAAIAKGILLHGQKPSEIKVKEPLATQMLLNLKTAASIGLAITPDALSMATTVIDR